MDFKELIVYKKAFSLAMEVYEVSKKFPNEEKYSLTDQIRRSSRSVCANIAEAYRKRLYIKNFISKLTDSQMQRTVKLLYGLILPWNVIIWEKKITLRCCTNPLKLGVC
jgi:hypothetical protein